MSPYIPRGYLTTSNAIDYTFRTRNPDLAASTFARSAELRRLYDHYRSEFPGGQPSPMSLADAIRLRDAAAKQRAVIMNAVNWRDTADMLRRPQPAKQAATFREEDLARLRELDGIGAEQQRLINAAAMELRSALAEGDLVAVLNCEKMPEITKFRWRGDDGMTIVREGRLSHHVEGTHGESVFCAVLIKEADLMGWLGLVLQTGDEAANDLERRSTEAAAVGNESGVQQSSTKPKFNYLQAEALMAAQKVSRKWTIAPEEKINRDFLLLQFSGVPNDSMRKIRRKLWPDMKRGPKPKPVLTAK